MIGPSIPLKRYKKNTNKNDLDEHDAIKEHIKPFILLDLLKNCLDLTNESTNLEHLATELSTPQITITVLYTLKFHSTMAGEEVENGWRSSKKINHKVKLALEDKNMGSICYWCKELPFES